VSLQEPDPANPATTGTMAPKAPKFEIKTPKGTRDWSGPDMVLREKIFKTITDVFSMCGRADPCQGLG
jgi:histidyl-tRNA synthetase